MRILLDTNAYSDWRRSGRWNETISTASEVLIPSIVLGELRYGFKGSVQEKSNEQNLIHFLRQSVVNTLAVGESTTRSYAVLKHYLRQSGKVIPENDIWIAALAMEHVVPLVTNDQHFDFLPQVSRIVE